MSFESPRPELFSQDSRDREAAIEAFEHAWMAGTPRSIDDFLSSFTGERLPLLCELIQAELDFRWKRGDPVPVEEYLGRYPEFGGDPPIVVDLIVAEWNLRQRFGISPAVEDFYRRFPIHCERLAEHRLAARTDRGNRENASARRSPLLVLDVIDGPDQNRRFESAADIILAGRAAESDFQLDRDPHLSRLHFRAEWRGNELWLEDLGSHNGTRVNGTRVSQRRLRHGDVISAGATRIAVLFPGEARPE